MAGDDEKDKGAAASEPQQNNGRSLQVFAQPPPSFTQSPGTYYILRDMDKDVSEL